LLLSSRRSLGKDGCHAEVLRIGGSFNAAAKQTNQEARKAGKPVAVVADRGRSSSKKADHPLSFSDGRSLGENNNLSRERH